MCMSVSKGEKMLVTKRINVVEVDEASVALCE